MVVLGRERFVKLEHGQTGSLSWKIGFSGGSAAG
jgi:hypothetical protein